MSAIIHVTLLKNKQTPKTLLREMQDHLNRWEEKLFLSQKNEHLWNIKNPHQLIYTFTGIPDKQVKGWPVLSSLPRTSGYGEDSGTGMQGRTPVQWEAPPPGAAEPWLPSGLRAQREARRGF